MLKFIRDGSVYCRSEENFKTSYVEVYPHWQASQSPIYFISKHLMLKFIANRIKGGHLTIEFQNILCWSLSGYLFSSRPVRMISKHLMLKFISTGLHGLKSFLEISKHLMLKFIKTILVRYAKQYKISKHLMLKFINNFVSLRGKYIQFQNILCWSLSGFAVPYILELNKFQNILCWSLSIPQAIRRSLYGISKHLMLKFIIMASEACKPLFWFQNILCWSLSPHFLVTFISFYLFSPSFFLISIIFTKHQPIFFFLSNISQIPRLYNTFSTFFFFSPGKYFYNSQSGMGCSSDVFTTENAWS